MSRPQGVAPWYADLRERLLINARAVATLLRVDIPTVNDWDSGRRRPGPAARTQLRVLVHLVNKAGDESAAAGRQIVAMLYENGRDAAWRYVLDYIKGAAQLETEPVCYVPQLKREATF